MFICRIRFHRSCKSHIRSYTGEGKHTLAQTKKHRDMRKVAIAAALTCTSLISLSNTAHADGPVAGPVYVYNGMGPSNVLPTNSVEIPSATYVANKEVQVAGDTEQLALLTVANETSSVPDESSAGAFTPCVQNDCNSTPGSYALPISGHLQEKDNWCGPATAQMILSSMQVATPTQTVLATEMGTGTDSHTGTLPKDMPPSLNHRQTRNTFVWRMDTSSPADLVARTITDTYRLKSTFQMSIDVASIGYYPAGYSGAHSLDVYGYYTQNNGGLYTWDVEDGRMFGQPTSYAGKHPVTAAKAYGSMKTSKYGIIW